MIVVGLTNGHCFRGEKLVKLDNGGLRLDGAVETVRDGTRIAPEKFSLFIAPGHVVWSYNMEARYEDYRDKGRLR